MQHRSVFNIEYQSTIKETNKIELSELI